MQTNVLLPETLQARQRHDQSPVPSRLVPRVLLLLLLIALCLVRQRAETLEQALVSRETPVVIAGH